MLQCAGIVFVDISGRPTPPLGRAAGQGTRSRSRKNMILTVAFLILLASLDEPPAVGAGASKQAPVADPPSSIQFQDASAQAGIDFRHENGGTVPIVIYETVPPGAAMFDCDGDGDLDLYAVQSGHRRFPAPAGSPSLTGRLFRNDGPGPGGVPRFTDVTERAGVGSSMYGIGAVAADVDNDGDGDLYVTAYGADVLYLNRGDCTFTDVTGKAGASDPRMSLNAAFADVDADGRLDLYVSNYVDFSAGPEFCYYEGVKSGCSDLEYPGQAKSLYLNQGLDESGVPRFREAAAERGVQDPQGRGMGVIFGDIDDDGDQDLYVANDGGTNRLFINDGKGSFKDNTLMSGTGYSEEGRGQASMGVDMADFDGDGRVDIITTNFSMETEALYRNEGGGQFSYYTALAGLAEASFLPLSWGTQFFDADLDGDLDLFVANGHVYDVAAQINPLESFAQKNQLYMNRGDGTFTEISGQAGPGLAAAASHRGAALGDVDDDGDVDIYVAVNDGPGKLLLNTTPRDGRHALRLRLVGSRSNRDAVGSKVTVHAGGRRQIREVRAGGSYLSGSDKRLLFGLGRLSVAEKVEVRWPSGATQIFSSLPADKLLVLVEGEASPRGPER